jgi:hypothetical protein
MGVQKGMILVVVGMGEVKEWLNFFSLYATQ